MTSEKVWEAIRRWSDEDALDFLADIAGGDARSALNAVELGILTTETECRMERSILHWMWHPECIQKRVVSYDKDRR
ncbi:MAG: hypothetical protein ACLR2O_06400 [Coprococcus sp.]